jgi:GDSL-like Lipase/Acylhydrolase family
VTGRHVVLLGDSIFDNAVYTRGEPAVIDHLRSLLPSGWKATLRAVDGATTGSVDPQLRSLPPDASHLVLAIGGNDALGNIDLLARPVGSTTEALLLFRRRLEEFHESYTRAVDRVIRLGTPTTVCTIYNGNLDAETAAAAEVALMMFNDVIIHVAIERRLTVIELRQVCDEPDDYANPIEPSGRGGRKIAVAIARAIGAMSASGEPSRVYGREDTRK